MEEQKNEEISSERPYIDEAETRIRPALNSNAEPLRREEEQSLLTPEQPKGKVLDASANVSGGFKALNSTMVQSNNSSFVGATGHFGCAQKSNSRSNHSRYNASAISKFTNNNQSAVNLAQRQTMVNLTRPQSALTGITPALAYKRGANGSQKHSLNQQTPSTSQGKYNAVRSTAKTPVKSNASRLGAISNKGAKSTQKKRPVNLNSSTIDVSMDNIRPTQLAYSIQQYNNNRTNNSSYTQLHASAKQRKQQRTREVDISNHQTFGVRNMGTLYQSNNNSVNLGPGAYEPKIELTKERSPSALIFGSEERAPFKNEAHNSSIGECDLNTFGKDAIKISIHPKLQASASNKNPGPGYYNPDYSVVKESTQGARISPSKSHVKASDNVPGPGSYSFSFKNVGVDTPTYTISGGARGQVPIKSPGPGTYNPEIEKVREKSPEYTMGQKHTSHHKKSKSSLVGPGYYPNKSFTGSEGPHYSIPKEPKSRGYYNPNDQAIKDKVKAFKLLSQSDNKRSHQQNPPVGQYNIEGYRSIGKEGPKYTMLPKSRSRAEISPIGPGHYDVQPNSTKARPVGIKIGQARKNQDVKYATPGPGWYQQSIDGQFGKNAPKVSILQKPVSRLGNQNPGPGQYQPNFSPTKETSVAYAISKGQRMQMVSQDRKLVPGPGQYDSPTRFGEGPKVRIHEKLADNSRNLNPGPAQYYPTQVLVRQSSPKIKIDPSSVRVQAVSKERELSPGPGSYDVKLRPENPLYSIGQKHAGRNDNGVPGPGQYEPMTTVIHERVLAKTIPKADRNDSAPKDDHPGPGWYDPKVLRYPQISYGLGKVDRQSPVSRDQRLNPGPGTYTSPQRFGQDGVKYSIGQKSPNKSFDQLPGPGQYDPLGNLVHGRLVLGNINPPHLDAAVHLSPGPGTYDPAYQNVRQSSPQWDIAGYGQRSPQVSIDLMSQPGPGAYEQKQLIGGPDSLKYTIGIKPYLKIGNGNPAPGQYDPNDDLVHQRSPSHPMCRSIKGLHLPQDLVNMPAPGTYDAKDQRYPCIKYTIGNLERKSPVSRDQRLNPGPGTYTSPQRFGQDGVKYSIGQKSPSRNLDQNPGPGHYDPSRTLVFQRSPTAKIFPTSFSPRPKTTVGPGSYDPIDILVRERSPKYKIGGQTERTRQVSPDSMLRPGPGHYEQRLLIGGPHSLKYTIGQKPHDDRDNYYPGPGTYQPADELTYQKSPQHSFSKQERNRNMSPSQMGPGSYDPIDGRYPQISYKISLTERPDQVTRDQRAFPSPGQYEQPNLVGKDAPKYTFGEKHPGLIGEDVPGPGTYDPNYTLAHPRSPLGKINPYYENHQINGNPGPGYYNPDASITHQQSPNYNIGGGIDRMGLVPSDLKNFPGPGTYEQRDLIGGPDSLKYTIGEKPHDPSNNNYPGPGTYYQPDLVGKDAPKYTMGEKRGECGSDDFPGPGTYTNPTLISGPDSLKFTIGERLPQPSSNHYPGPGTYHQPDLVGKDAPKYTMGERPGDNSVDQFPGPGTYDQGGLIGGPDSLKFTIGNKIDSAAPNNYPGPGTYQQPDLVGKDAPRYTMGERRGEYGSDDFPGPGTYTNPTLISGPDSLKFTIGERLPQPSSNHYPGPGTYHQPDLVGKDAPKYTMGERRGESSTEDFPGPGTYDQQNLIGGPESLKFTVGIKLDTPRDNHYPGPGTYESPDMIGKDAPRFTLGQRVGSFTSDSFPAPGQYDASLDFNHPRPILGKIFPYELKTRFDDTPGQGQYEPCIDLTVEKSPIVSIGGGASDRPNTVSRDQMLQPGPGHYETRQLIGANDTRMFTIGEKLPQYQNNGYPGPGTYDPSVDLTKETSPAKTISSGCQRDLPLSEEIRNRPGPGAYDPNVSLIEPRSPLAKINPPPSYEGGIKDAPGPGTYDPELSAVKERAPYGKMAKSKRDFLTHSASDLINQPGPGAYNPQLPGNSQSFTIGEKIPEAANNFYPGPGSYFPTMNQTETRSPRYDFSKSPERQGEFSRNDGAGRNLGPGSYDRKFDFVSGNTSLSYSVPQGDREQRVNDNPGPGQYKIPVKFAAQQLYAIPYINEEFKYV